MQVYTSASWRAVHVFCSLYRGVSRRFIVPSRALGAVLIAGLLSLSLSAADLGTVTGRVLDAASDNFLEGAEITVEGTSLRTTSARGGAFTLTRVPTGSQQIVVNYLGSSPATETVVVTADSTVSVQIKLNSDTIILDEFVVVGTPEGVAQALALQRVSVQSKLVAASDQFGEISEGNVGEYLKFLPGVSIDYNVNDARGISLRGLSTAFTIVAVDGTPMAGSSSIDDTRRFEFEQIAMNNVETTELYKTVTPDIPATATGGFVNFVTKSAFDHDDIQRVTYNVSVGAPSSNFHFSEAGSTWGRGTHRTVRPSVEANFSRKLSEKVGININYRFSDKYDDAPRIIANWNTAGAGALANPFMTSYTVQDEQKLTNREALATKIDFRPSERTRISFTGQVNYYDLLFTQRGLVFNLGSNATMSGDSVISGTAGTRNVTNSQLQRRKWGTTWHFNSTFEHDFEGGSKLRITPYWSQANGYYDDILRGFISTNQAITYSAAGIPFNRVQLDDVLNLKKAATVRLSHITTGAVTPTDYLRSLSNYTFANTATGGNFQSRPWEAIDNKQGVNGNYVFDLNTSLPVKIDTGVAFDSVERDIWRPTLRGVIPTTTGPTLTALVATDYTHDVAFGFGPIQSIDPYKVWEVYKNNLTNLGVNDRRNYQEDNTAAYVRADVSITPNFLLVGGVRWEDRSIDATASALSNGRQEVTAATVDYNKLFPSLSFKYTPTRSFVYRGGYSRTVGPPDYAELLPLVTVESAAGTNNGTISVPAPDLKPYFSDNLDFSVDYYLGNTGVIGLSTFYKRVENFISSRGMTAEEKNLALTSRGYDPADFVNGSATTTVNGGSSNLRGFEVSYAQKLTMLPKPFDGLNLQANYSWVHVNADNLDTFYSQSRSVSPKSFNVILGYRRGRFSTTITRNWVDESLYGGFVNTSFFTGTSNVDPNLDTRLLRYKKARAQTDVKVEWAFRRELAVYLLVRNITNSGRDEFFRGYTEPHKGLELPMRYGEFGEPYLVIGMRGSF